MPKGQYTLDDVQKPKGQYTSADVQQSASTPGFDEQHPVLSRILDWSAPILSKPLGGEWAQEKLKQATELEQEEINKAHGPESQGKSFPSRLGHQYLSTVAGAARVPYGMLSMTPAEAALTVAGTASGNPEIPAAYWATKGTSSLTGIGQPGGVGSVQRAIQNPTPENVGAPFADASMIAGSVAGGMPNRPAGMAPFNRVGVQPPEAPPGVYKPPNATPSGGRIQRVVRATLGMGKEPTLKVGQKALAENAEEVTKVSEKNANAQTAYQEKAADVAAKQAEIDKATNLKNQQAQADYWNTRRTVEDKNEIAHVEHQKAVADVEALNKAAAEDVGKRGELGKKITNDSAALGEQVQALEANVRAQGKAKYDVINDAVAGDAVPADTLAQSVRHAQQKIIAGTPESVKQFNEILSKGEAQDIETSVGRAVPGTALYDTLVKEGVISPTETLQWRDLQGLYTELGDKMAKGNLPGDVYNALKYVKNSIGEQMGAMAERHGVGAAWNDARGYWQQYQNTFHDMTPVSQGGSPVARMVRAADPAYVAAPILGKASTRAVQMLKAYDPNIAANAAQIASDYTTMNSLPKSFKPKAKPALTGVSAVPQPPEPSVGRQLQVPEPPTTEPLPGRPNLTEAVRDAREVRVQKFIDTLRSPYALAYEIPGAIVGMFSGKMPLTSFMGGSFAVRQGLAAMLESPKVTEWLTKPTPHDIALLNTLGPEARTQLQGAFTSKMIKEGIRPSPAMKSFLTKGQVATVMSGIAASQASQPSTPESVMLAMKNGTLSQDEGNRLLQRMKGKGSVVRPMAPPQ